MALYADASCVLKVNVHCEACKMKTVEILNSIIGVYSVTIDADEGIARIYGEVDPNILLKAIARSGRHAEIVRVNIKHPQIKHNNSYDHRGLLENSCGHRYRRTLLENSYRDDYYPATSREVPDYPLNSRNYHSGSPPPTWVPSYSPREYDLYDEDRINCCTIM
ncbi:hypothetical protein ACH5RR_027781 [Cinchona calisaya]|uniref:HMA domain-containing protein n=1 Tax=Cinchona calisaya TaxID=153742 RepID=A0ABD2YQG5_9GENT